MKTLILLFLLASGIPLTEAARADTPKTERPGTEWPETETPETERPGRDALQTETPEKEAPVPLKEKLLTDWMDIQLRAIRNTKNPSHHFRQNCYISIALYESLVNGDKKYYSLVNQLNGLDSLPKPPKSRQISWLASANAAMGHMLKHFYSDNPNTIKSIDSMQNATVKHLLEEGTSKQEVETGSDYGTSIALAILDWCKSDGSDKENAAYEVPKGDGMWEPTPPAFGSCIRPWAKNSRTIVPGSLENSLPPPPCTFSKDSASEFYHMVMDVYKESESHNPEHKNIALHWDDAPDGTSIGAGGHWLHILRNELEQRKTPPLEGARIWAAMSIAMFDASIGCFKAKYTYNVLRPVTYIRSNMNKPGWSPLIITPSHPEYPAAHATISMAAATVLADMLGKNAPFVDNTYEYKGLKARSYNSFTDAGNEAGMSRLYGGIHYRPSIEAGYKVGETIANNVLASLEFMGK